MNDLFQQIVGGILRTLIAAAGAYLAAKGISISGTQLDTVAGVLTILAMGGWSITQKVLTNSTSRSVTVASAVASAEHGTPVIVTVTPPGEENIATRVSSTEAAAAPSVPIGVIPQPAPLVQ